MTLQVGRKYITASGHEVLIYDITSHWTAPHIDRYCGKINGGIDKGGFNAEYDEDGEFITAAGYGFDLKINYSIVEADGTRCTCGLAAVGSKGRHSDWCDKEIKWG